MKLLKKLNISSQNQLRKYIFAYIVAILFCLLMVFVFFGNLNNVWQFFQTRDELEIDQRAEYKKVVELVEEQAGQESEVESTKTTDIVLWGQEDKSMKLISAQLENMKEGYQIKEELEDCLGAEILFICKGDFAPEEMALLSKYSEEGMTLFFSQIPEEASLKYYALRNLLGIESYDGIEKKSGVRLAKKILFGETIENEESFFLQAVTLKTHTEVYSAALEEEEEIDIEDLSPTFWRYQKDGSSGNVYVVEQMLLEETTGYAVISFLFTDLYQVYMYPIINAYCFMVSGMPYTEEFSSDFLYSMYERNSIGVQNDIFFPEFNRCEERYEVKATWYSSEEKEKLSKTESALLQYYLRGLDEKKNEIGIWNPYNGLRTVNSPFENQAIPWRTEFQWIEEDQSVNIPYNVIQGEEHQNIIFRNMGMCKGVGLNTVFTDIEVFLKEAENGEDDWVHYCRSLETILGVEKEKMPWIERTSVGEAIYRIQTFSVMEPKIEYSDSRIDVEIGNFTGKAYFYLSLPKKIKSVENAEVTEIYEDFYMVEAVGEHVSIVYEEKKR